MPRARLPCVPPMAAEPGRTSCALRFIEVMLSRFSWRYLSSALAAMTLLASIPSMVRARGGCGRRCRGACRRVACTGGHRQRFSASFRCANGSAPGTSSPTITARSRTPRCSCSASPTRCAGTATCDSMCSTSACRGGRGCWSISVGTLFFVAPWIGIVLWFSWATTVRSVAVFEKFPETWSPGYWLFKVLLHRVRRAGFPAGTRSHRSRPCGAHRSTVLGPRIPVLPPSSPRP